MPSNTRGDRQRTPQIVIAIQSRRCIASGAKSLTDGTINICNMFVTCRIGVDDNNQPVGRYQSPIDSNKRIGATCQ